MIADTLYFGANIPNDARTVSLNDFETFLHVAVETKFRGFTYWQATGAWENTREASYVLRIVHDDTPEETRRIAEIAGAYKATFRQEAVMRETSTVSVEFV